MQIDNNMIHAHYEDNETVSLKIVEVATVKRQ